MKTVISAEDRSSLNINELKRYSGLLRYLSLRDVFVRYKQTWLGFGWSVIRPLTNIAIFGTLSYFIDRSDHFTDKFLSVSAGVIFWQLITSSITDVSSSLNSNAAILTKVYFPKIVLPLSGLLVCLVDFVIAFLIFFAALVVLNGLPHWHILLLPFVVLYGMIVSFSLGLLFATASVKYRDVRILLPFILQILFYASPVFITTEFILGLNIPEAVKVIYQLNPFVFILNTFRYSMFGAAEGINAVYGGISVLISLVILFAAIKYFFRFERSFADYI